MAITRSAKKALRVSKRKNIINDKRLKKMRDTIKIVRKDVLNKDKKSLREDLKLAFQALDKAAKTGVIKKGTANRKKSRLAKAIAKLDK